MTTANKITIARIVMIPLFVMMAIYYGHGLRHGAPQNWQRWVAIALFALAAASDGIDGYIARHYNQKTQLGIFLDPIADKGLLLAAILTLSFGNWSYEFPIWFPVVVIGRDLIVLSGALTLKFLNGTLQVRPSWAGKTATALQMVSIVLAMLQLDLFCNPAWTTPGKMSVALIDIPVALAGFFTIVSGAQYVLDGISQINARGHGDPKPWPEL